MFAKVLISAAMAVTAGSVAAALPPPPLARPTAQWVVDFAEKRCLASRAYVAGNNELVVGIQPLPSTDRTRIYIQAASDLRTLDSQSAKISIGNERLPAGYLAVEPVVKPGHVRYSFGLDRGTLQKLIQAGRLTVDSKKLRADIPLTKLPSIAILLDQCSQALLAHWGLTPEAQAALVSFPKPKGSRPILLASDYPKMAIDRLAIGVVEVVLNVDSSGKAVGCRMVRSSGHPDLDAVTCKRLQQRAKFDPAINRQGQAVTSVYYMPVHWSIAN